jgi:hypothetical protein
MDFIAHRYNYYLCHASLAPLSLSDCDAEEHERQLISYPVCCIDSLRITRVFVCLVNVSLLQLCVRSVASTTRRACSVHSRPLLELKLIMQNMFQELTAQLGVIR